MIRSFALFLSGALALTACSTEPEAKASDTSDISGPPHIVAQNQIEAGRYLAEIGGCQDCHTADWPQTGGNIPDESQLLGVPVGFKGPWGTSYANNLRLVAAAYTPEEWVEMMHTRQGLPPMPWFAVNRMSESDLLAIHAFLLSLGETGETMPAAVPPGVEPATPYIYFMPVAPNTASQ